MNTLSIIVPAFNEENTIVRVIESLLALPFISEIIVVNDASSDKTKEKVTPFVSEKLKLVSHEKNKGKTAALLSGFQHATCDIIAVQDADLEYDPAELERLLEQIIHKQADVVYGSRFLVREASRVLYFYHFLANKTLTFLSNMLTNKNMTDIETCYKMFRAPLIKNMPIVSSGFGFEVEVTARISKTKARIYEVPISYYGRTFEEGKKISYFDGVMALYYIFRFNFFQGKKGRRYIQAANAFLTDIQK